MKMRIGLTTRFYPPDDIGEIPRQRQILARALVNLGHEVHIFTQGNKPDAFSKEGIWFHYVTEPSNIIPFSNKYPGINDFLTYSLSVHKKIHSLHRDKPLDILDTPLWNLEGFTSLTTKELPIVLRLQTTQAHLVEIEKRLPTHDELGVIALEKISLQNANGIIAYSQTVLSDIERFLNANINKSFSRVIPLGLPDLAEYHFSLSNNRQNVEALVVGRLEKCKGTQILFDILPRLLKDEPSFSVRFIGVDDSRSDSLREEVNQNYFENLKERWPNLRGRVIFEGSVSEVRLLEAYTQADFIIIPRTHESFGLVYLEAMRAGRPIITFATNTAQEIFPKGEENGAILVSTENNDALVHAILDLTASSKRRTDLAIKGREQFLNYYLDTCMASATLVFYEEIRDSISRPKLHKPRRIFQVMEALDVGDAVSSITLRNAELLHEMGVGGTILGIHYNPQLAEKICPIENLDLESEAALIFHYWNYSHLEQFLRKFHGPKAIHFHNITPPEYFLPGSLAYETTSRGYRQIDRIMDWFDLVIGDSSFNLQICQNYLSKPKPSIIIPPLIDRQEILSRSFDTALLETLRCQEGRKFLSVGRIAKSKRQDLLLKLFDHYYRWIDCHAWLYLVGNDRGNQTYREELEALRQKLPSKEHIIFTGKVSDQALYSYYRAADIFISASEHEGFCVPIVEAMALDIPVLAFGATAVPETMGEGGILIHSWDITRLSELLYILSNDVVLRSKILEGQQKNLERFSANEIRARLLAAVRYLEYGDTSPFFLKV